MLGIPGERDTHPTRARATGSSQRMSRWESKVRTVKDEGRKDKADNAELCRWRNCFRSAYNFLAWQSVINYLY
jgi:hypothetical protein